MLSQLAQVVTDAPPSALTLGGMFAAVLALAKGIEYLATVIKNRGANSAPPVPGRTQLATEEKAWLAEHVGCHISEGHDRILHQLLDLHTKTDDDGIPLVYVPRSFVRGQNEMIGLLREIRDRLGNLSGR